MILNSSGAYTVHVVWASTLNVTVRKVRSDSCIVWQVRSDAWQHDGFAELYGAGAAKKAGGKSAGAKQARGTPYQAPRGAIGKSELRSRAKGGSDLRSKIGGGRAQI